MWVTFDDGITGSVHGHPLEDWCTFGTTWKIADPNTSGGLCMIYGLYAGVPMENVKAVMDAMEKYAFYHA